MAATFTVLPSFDILHNTDTEISVNNEHLMALKKMSNGLKNNDNYRVQQ